MYECPLTIKKLKQITVVIPIASPIVTRSDL